jgi:hypothetical protein
MQDSDPTLPVVSGKVERLALPLSVNPHSFGHLYELAYLLPGDVWSVDRAGV